MNADSLLNQDWSRIVSRLGGAAALASTARICKAFLRPRGIRNAVDLLRIILAYCLGDRGLRATAAWAAASGLADISHPAILYRLRHCGDWLTVLIGQLLAASTPTPARGRLIRLIDASTVAKPGPEAKKTNKLWRVHAAFDLPAERFGYFELTDEHGGEQVDRIPVVAGEIRIGDRVYLQPDRIAAVLDAGGDVVVRAGWRNARWLDEQGEPLDLLADLSRADERIDRTVRIGRKSGPPLALRLIAIRKPDAARRPHGGRCANKDASLAIPPRGKRCRPPVGSSSSPRCRTTHSPPTMCWHSIDCDGGSNLGFKRLKSLVGLKSPPGIDDRSARPWVLAHLLMILLLEPLVDALEDSPRWASAA